MSKEMSLKEFKKKAEELLSPLDDLIHDMPLKGNSIEECQRTYLKYQLNSLRNTFNGTEKSDLVDDKYECDICGYVSDSSPCYNCE